MGVKEEVALSSQDLPSASTMRRPVTSPPTINRLPPQHWKNQQSLAALRIAPSPAFIQHCPERQILLGQPSVACLSLGLTSDS